MPASRATWPLLAAALALAACQAVPAVTAPAPAELRLDLGTLWAPARALLAARAAPAKVEVSIAGPDGVVLLQQTVPFGVDGTFVSLGNVPTGPRLLISLQAIDVADQPIKGQVLRTIGALVAGPNTMAVSAATTLAGDVVATLMALDRAEGTKIVAQVDYAALERAVPGWLRGTRAAHPGLLDAGVIARDIRAANGAVPVSTPAYLQAAGRIVVTPGAWPPGATALATVDDPASMPTQLEGRPAVIGPVSPGTWTLTIRPDQPGLSVLTQTIVVPVGGTAKAIAGFAPPEPRPALAGPKGAPAFGVVPADGGGQVLVMAGGTTVVARGVDPLDPRFAPFVIRLPAVAAVPPLPTNVESYAPASAVHAGRLFWFGGLDLTGPIGTAFAYEPQGVGRVVPRAPMPDGLKLAAAAAGTVGNKIYVTGGLTPDRNPNRRTLAYDPTNDTWAGAGFPEIAPHRISMASAVVGDTWYLFGGMGDDHLTAPQAKAGTRPVSDASAWKPGFDQSFRALPPMPTPRAGAVAVAVGSKIFVIGGVTRQGALTGAVEAYDVAADRWELRAPLARPRAYAAAGLVDGLITVAGGTQGLEPATDVPLADVEAVRP